MRHYLEQIGRSYADYWAYLSGELRHPTWHSYVWGLLALSLLTWIAELVAPWRAGQARFRRGFWIDAFYVYFNFFGFALLGYYALANVAADGFGRLRAALGVADLVVLDVRAWPTWAQLLTMFVVADFVAWNVHRTLHRVPWLWEFHKVHHSTVEMGFAAHLRFHWMETIVYKAAQYLPLAMIGFGPRDFFVVHMVATAIGHLNHSNLALTYGPLRYVLNNPVMHIWHHAKTPPAGRPHGVNFGISLSLWDYLFGTAAIPADGRDVALGFAGDERFPTALARQLIYPLGAARPASGGAP